MLITIVPSDKEKTILNDRKNVFFNAYPPRAFHRANIEKEFAVEED
jgi:hypothetical protein